MAQRIGGNSGVVVPPGVQTDNTLDQQRQQQIKQLQEHELVNNREEADRVVTNVIQGLKSQVQSGTQAKQQQPTQTDLGRMIATFQREHGLPVTGRIDPATFGQLRDKGLTQAPPAAPPSQSPPSSPSQRAAPNAPASPAPSSSTPSSSAPSSPAPSSAAPAGVAAGSAPGASSTTVRGADAGGASTTKAAPAPGQRGPDPAAQRQARSAADQQMRARVDQGPSSSSSQVSRSSAAREASQSTPVRDAFEAGAPTNKADRVIDPSRLLASLIALGMGGKKGNLEEAIKSLQASVGLPPTGKLDPKTMDELEKKGALADVDAKKAPATDKTVDKQQVRRALNEVTSRTAADRDIKRDPIRPQAPTNKPTTSADVAARAPVSSTVESPAKEQARLDNVLAQQDAFERGVQEGKGDPNAAAGHGEVKGEGQGVAGSGGQSGGGTPGVTGQGARAAAENEEVGEESAVGNAKAGDDDFDDDARGNANLDGDGDGAGGEGEHWSVPPLSEQMHTALDQIARDDDGSGPVTYTWDVTFFRPGVYAAGQPAEEMWHVVVHQANAFDPVWQQAADAIASRMLYAEPDATPPTIEDFVAALRRARVR